MNPLDIFLREHAVVHADAVAPSVPTLADVFDGLDEQQLRACPSGLNSLAWLLWHIARVEDSCVSQVVMGEPQLFDGSWAERLRRDASDGDGEGMTPEQVAELSATVDLAALREYRDAVGRRTREHAARMWPDGWHEPLFADTAAAAPWLIGQPRESLLAWWAVCHSHYHIGQAAMVRRLVTG